MGRGDSGGEEAEQRAGRRSLVRTGGRGGAMQGLAPRQQRSPEAAASEESPHSLSVDDSVGVEHGHDLEDVGLPQAGCERAAAHQELQRALHDPAGVGFSRVHSGRQEDERTVPWEWAGPGAESTG